MTDYVQLKMIDALSFVQRLHQSMIATAACNVYDPRSLCCTVQLHSTLFWARILLASYVGTISIKQMWGQS
jgi:hypothetical protein